MDIDQVRTLSFEEIRRLYKEYLKKQGLSNNTVNTALNDTFYLWRNENKDLFWDSVISNDFENNARTKLLQVLHKNSKGNANKLVNGYLSHMRRFCKFLYEENQSISQEHEKELLIKKTKPKVDVPTPSSEQVDFYIKKWLELENYRLQENALEKLFFQLCPRNDNIEDILIKAVALNDFYSTNIFSIYPVAKHILSLDIDDRLKEGDVNLVGDMQKVIIGDVEKNFYSFATKYCSHHKPLDYPIYDSYVEKVLKYFRNNDTFSQFNDKDLKNYGKFKEILIDFRKFYGLEKYNLKQIDQYIWQLGKEYFPINYNKKKR